MPASVSSPATSDHCPASPSRPSCRRAAGRGHPATAVPPQGHLDRPRPDLPPGRVGPAGEQGRGPGGGRQAAERGDPTVGSAVVAPPAFGGAPDVGLEVRTEGPALRLGPATEQLATTPAHTVACRRAGQVSSASGGGRSRPRSARWLRRQHPVEVGRLGDVVADPAGRAELGQRGPDPGRRQARPRSASRSTSTVGSQLSRHADQVGVVGHLVAGEAVEHRALAGEPAAGLRRQGQRQAQRAGVQLPGARHRRAPDRDGRAVRRAGPWRSAATAAAPPAARPRPGRPRPAPAATSGAATGRPGPPTAPAVAGGRAARAGTRPPRRRASSARGSKRGGDHLHLGEPAQPPRRAAAPSSPPPHRPAWSRSARRARPPGAAGRCRRPGPAPRAAAGSRRRWWCRGRPSRRRGPPGSTSSRA